MTKDHQKMTDSFESLVLELHELTNEMIVEDGLDMSIKTKAACLNTYLELNLSEYFKERK